MVVVGLSVVSVCVYGGMADSRAEPGRSVLVIPTFQAEAQLLNVLQHGWIADADLSQILAKGDLPEDNHEHFYTGFQDGLALGFFADRFRHCGSFLYGLATGRLLGEGGGALVVLDPLALYLFEDAFKLIDTEELE